MKHAPLFFAALLMLSMTAPLLRADALPASGDKAGDALAASPRHGEWIDVPLEGGEIPLKTWVVYPERADKAPVVIVIHEVFGLTDWVRGVADALAEAGFIAVAPDMLSGMGPDGGGTDALGDHVRSEIRKLTPDDRARRLDAVRAYALQLPAANGKVGCVGFCWGGGTSFIYAARQPALDAAVVYYGSAPDDRDELAQVQCPVLGLYGGDDARVTATVEPTARQMSELGKSFTTRVYDGAGHGFLRQQDGRDGRNMAASEAAWRETLTFFRDRLRVNDD